MGLGWRVEGGREVRGWNYRSLKGIITPLKLSKGTHGNFQSLSERGKKKKRKK